MKNFKMYAPGTWMVLVAMFVNTALVGAAHGAEAVSDEDFKALAAYGLGDSEVPLRLIAEAVRGTAGADAKSVSERKALEDALIQVLESDSSTEAKRFIFRMLGEIGGPESAIAVGKQLSDKALFHSAIVALEQMPLSEATTVLADGLEAAEDEARLALLAALGRQGNAEAAALIAPYLQAENPEVAYAASQALADLQDTNACRVVLVALQQAVAAEKPLFADAFLACAEGLMDSEAKEDALKALEMLCGADFPTHIRLAANSRLMSIYPGRAQDLLLGMLRDDDTRLNAEALMLARRMLTPEVTEALVMMLGEVADVRKPALLEVLGARGDAAALTSVRSLADHESSEVRRAALRATGLLGNDSLTRFLLERASSGPMDEQRVAREALARMPGESVNKRLMDIAASKAGDDMRERAVALLAERRAVETSEPLLGLVQASSDSVPDKVRAAALTALRTLASGEMLESIMQLALAPGVEAIRAILPQTIAEVAGRVVAEQTDAAQPVALFMASLTAATVLSDTQVAAARGILIEALALIGTEIAFNEARQALGYQEPEVRRAAIAALARFQRTDALDELRALIGVESDAALRALAYSAYLAALRNATVLPRRDVDGHLEFAYNQAQNAAARREFLTAAPQLPSLVCLRLIETLLDDEEVAAEALRAALQVGTALTGAWPQAARACLDRIASQEQAPELAAEAAKALVFMEKFEGHLVAWEMAGPYFEENITAYYLFDKTFPPETDAESANWRVFSLLPDAEMPYALELDRVVGGEERVVFLRTFITSETEQEAVLELGTNDGCRVWWNGELKHSLNIGRPLTPAEDKLPVLLKPGVNVFTLAVFQQGGAWRATARLTDAQGMPLPGLNSYPEMPGQE